LFEERLPSTKINKLVDVEKSVKACMTFIKKLVGVNPVGTNDRVPPTVITRLARGGKTTVVLCVAEETKAIGMFPSYIDLNSTFIMQDDETELESVVRLIGIQFLSEADNLAVTEIIEEKKQKVVFSKEKVLEWIKKINKPFILFIDELNKLGAPCDQHLSKFLTKNFLDEKNRYLVFSSHIPLNIDVSPFMPSTRCCEGIPLPYSNDLKAIQNIDSVCGYLTAYDIAFCGNIPSLARELAHSVKFFGQRVYS
jgi:hypothetical protein